MALRVQAFGEFDLSNDSGRRYRLASVRQQALLGYLAMAPGHSVARSQLAGLLWPDAPESEARHSLRQCLLVIRQNLGDDADALVVTPERVSLAPECWVVDVERFETLAASSNVTDLQAADSLYSGEVLSGIDLGGTPFDEWLRERRRVGENAAIRFWSRFAESQERAGDVYGATATLKKIIKIDPFDDASRRRLMQLLVRCGCTTAAIREFRDFSDLLNEHLDVQPAPETAQLYRSIVAQTRVSEDADLMLEAYALALEQLPDSIIVTNMDTRIVGFSRHAEESFGLQKADVLGKTPRIFHNELSSSDVPLRLARRALNHGQWTETVNLRSSDGLIVPMRRSVVTLRSPSGAPIGSFGMTSAYAVM